jgi:hypothetical protein
MKNKTLNSCLLKTTAFKIIIAASLLPLFLPQRARAQGPEGKSFGFGIVLGTLDAGSIKVWTTPDQAFVADFGGSWFGPLRLQGDYLWHFDAFHSRIVKMYAGPGLAVAFGNAEYFNEDGTSTVGIGARVMFGVNIIPRTVPLEIFVELGPLIGFVPNVGVGIDAGVGIRFYP